MNPRITRPLLPSALLLGALLGALAFAGPLDPPAGPVGPTFKTLDEVEPRIAISQTTTPGDADSLYKITQPGSYYLQGDIEGVPGKHGIEIATSNVTLDLNGFSLIGAPGSLDGVGVQGMRDNLIVRNGTIRGWGSDGVNLTATGAVGVAGVIENVVAVDNFHIGIRANAYSVVRGCVAHGNGQDGIFAQGVAIIADCTVDANGRDGINAGASGVLTRGVASGNTRDGVVAANGALIESVNARNNTGDGFSLTTTAIVSGCTAGENQDTGIRTGEICQIIGTLAERNGTRGIDAFFACIIADCTLASNTGDGANVDNDTVVMRTHAWSNGLASGSGAGIVARGQGARIQFNVVTDNDRGIETTDTGNLIVGNIASGNASNWNLIAGTLYGPVSNIAALASPAVLGSGGAPSALGSSPANPLTNFSY